MLSGGHAGEYQRWGGMASYSVAPVKAVSSLPEPLDMAQAATLNGEFDLGAAVKLKQSPHHTHYTV